MTKTNYDISRNLGELDFDTAVEKVTAALKTEGFGVLTEIDVKQTLKKKLDVDFRKYKILGACNPPLAHKALQKEILIGLLLPCNVVVFQEDDGTITASAIDPKEMFKVVNNPDMRDIVETVSEKIKNVMAAL